MALITGSPDKPVNFAFQDGLHLATTTSSAQRPPFDMTVLACLDRRELVFDVIPRLTNPIAVAAIAMARPWRVADRGLRSVAKTCARTGNGRRHDRGAGVTLVLALNAGSTSLKCGLFRMTGDECETVESTDMEGDDPSAIADTLATWPAPDVVGHRIVHGGAVVRDHCVIDESIMADLEAAKALAPLHVPPALAVVRWARGQFPGLPQVACLDTAFHAGMPGVARTYPLPVDIRAAGVVRYGFHGLSCASIVRQLGTDLPRRLVIAHLGGGCSVTAVLDGRSIDTTMGLTPAGGLIMSTRSGDLDPGILIYLMRVRSLDVDAIEGLVDRRSGLLGASDLSGDVRILRESSDIQARLAIRMFVAQAAKGIASMMTSLRGGDLLVFTGGIGENDQATRVEIAAELGWAGVGGSCAVRVLPSKEDEEISRIAAAFVRPSVSG